MIKPPADSTYALTRVLFQRELEHPLRADGADVESFDRILQVVLRAGGRRQVGHAIHSTVHGPGLRDVLLDQLKPGLTGEVRQIPRPASQKIVEGDNSMAFGQQAVAKV